MVPLEHVHHMIKGCQFITEIHILISPFLKFEKKIIYSFI